VTPTITCHTPTITIIVPAKVISPFLEACFCPWSLAGWDGIDVPVIGS
jgi:hypothetical protein